MAMLEKEIHCANQCFSFEKSVMPLTDLIRSEMNLFLELAYKFWKVNIVKTGSVGVLQTMWLLIYSAIMSFSTFNQNAKILAIEILASSHQDQF